MISIYLNDSVLTTQPRTIIFNLKPKLKKIEKIFSKKMYVQLYVELVSEERAFPDQCRSEQTKLKGIFFLVGVSCTHRVLCYLSAFGLPELDLLKSSRQSLFQKNNLGFSPHESVSNSVFS